MNLKNVYHGTNHFIDKFTLDFLKNGEHQDGVGVYFTTKKEVTDYYAGSNGNVYKAKINSDKIVSPLKEIRYSTIKKLIGNSPNFDDFVYDFVDYSMKGMTKTKAIEEIAKIYKGQTIQNLCKTFVYDIYSNNEKSFLEQIVKLEKIDGMEIEFDGFSNIVIFNPEIIIECKNLNIKAEKEYQFKKKTLIEKNTKIKNFISSYKSKEELEKDLHFHGTSVKNINKLITGGDNILWTSDSIQISQNYISDFSNLIIYNDISAENRISDSFDKIFPTNKFDLLKLEIMGYEVKGEKDEYDNFKSYSVFKNEERVNIPTTHDFELFMSNNGYFKEDNKYKIKISYSENKIKLINGKEKKQGELFLIKGISKLNILDISLDESDLLNKQYTKYELFSKLNEYGYDGIKINDFLNSDYYGNLEHISIGLTKEALKKVEYISIDCEKFDWSKEIKFNKYLSNDINLENIINENHNNKEIKNTNRISK